MRNEPTLRSQVARSARLLLIASLMAVVPARAQEAEPLPSARPELGVGLTMRVPGFSDLGLGPVATAQWRTPSAPGHTGFVTGLSYAFVPLTSRLPDGSANNSAMQAVYGTLGVEWHAGLNSRVDLQWNPGLSGVVRWGAQPSWRTGVPMQRDLSAASLGFRWGAEEGRVNYAVRLHASLNPLAFFGSVYPTFQVMIGR